MDNAIAIVGMACRYPDARSPIELWENALAGRRAFRRMPAERLRIEDYFSADPLMIDSIYSTEACLIDDYEFDRVKYRVATGTYRSADHAHWLALDVAAKSLEDAGFKDAAGLPRETTGVLVGNTLTGEFSRAATLRLRWPYVRRVLESMLLEAEWSPDTRVEFLRDCEQRYKKPFAPVNEETLAGNLSNTIAGRICNHFDLKGSGYTVDGACASSLLAVAMSCSALIAGDLDVALAGGVDLSIDPFELVGFAKAGALAKGPMLVYDERSSGFLPGEGCGFVVLMRHPDAVARGCRIRALIRGWGVSSDGAGGITRPETAGQMLALERAYGRAGFGIETVAYFEGHGTGTSVGDTTELKTLSDARRKAAAECPAAIGSIKANMGHTKAAAGVAGLIKAVMAIQHQIIPPTIGCELPHGELNRAGASLRAPRECERWPEQQAIRAGVSAMGFGGVNTHVTLEGVAPLCRGPLTETERAMSCSPRDAELFLFSSDSTGDLIKMVMHLSNFTGRLSYAEMGDLAAHLASGRAANRSARLRAAIVASTPAELENRLGTLLNWLEQGASRNIDLSRGTFIANSQQEAIGFLFPGQGSPVYPKGGAFARSFPFIKEIYARAGLPLASSSSATELAQPAIITASIAALRLLEKCGLHGDLAIGHSVGEIAALHWAGAIDGEAAIRIASVRGRAMADVRGSDGKMASVRAGRDHVARMLEGTSLVIACINGAEQTVVSGAGSQIEEFIAIARQRGLSPTALPVSHAFHSPLVAPAMMSFQEHLSSENFRPLVRRVVSTVTGTELSPDANLPRLLIDQIVSPVLFADALEHVLPEVGLFVEIGPGDVLSSIVRDWVTTPVVSVDAGGESLKGLLKALAAAYVLGAPTDTAALYESRFNRPFDLGWNPSFFVNPCELAPLIDGGVPLDLPVGAKQTANAYEQDRVAVNEPSENGGLSSDTRDGILELVTGLVAERTDLPPAAIQSSYKLLGDLHLNSITVSQIVAEAARRLTLAPPIAPTDYSAVSIADVAVALEGLRVNGKTAAGPTRTVPAVDSWVRSFQVELREKPLKDRQRQASGRGKWQLVAPPNCSLGEALLPRLQEIDAEGVAVILALEEEESNIGLLLEGAHAALSNKNARYFLLVQHKTFGAAFVRSLHLEAPWINCCVVSIPQLHSRAVELISAEAASAAGFLEVVYDSAGLRRVPQLGLLESPGTSPVGLLESRDVVLVSGGGKGIAAECALALARRSRVRLAILGRSSRQADAELEENLRRLISHGVEFRYYACNVTDAEAVLDIARKAEKDLGAITGIIHGAGINRPKLIESLTAADFVETLGPKLRGARNLLEAIDPSRLRLFVTFGSLIARTGMRGEAHYALANELLRDLTERWQLDHPQCRSLCIEWSVWAGAGMGQRLGALDSLLQEGISPISLDQGIATLARLLTEGSASGSVVVTGRFGDPPTVDINRPELPLRRFLEHTRMYYPGVELIAEAEISMLTDPYAGDHVFHGDALFPAVMGLEAMAQTAMALAARDDLPVFEDVEFNRAIVVPRDGATRISIAALVRRDRAVEVVIRSESTEYQVDHFRALCRFEGAKPGDHPPSLPFGSVTVGEDTSEFIDLVPEKELYGTLLFHQGRFVRVNGYHKIGATECVAEIDEADTSWFGAYLPRVLMLGCPARRDAAIHAIQVCVPNASLLPVGAGRLRIYRTDGKGPCRVTARERERSGDVFVYDVQVVAQDGTLLELWEGLRLRRVSSNPLNGVWPLSLLTPLLERMITDTIGSSPVSIAFHRGNSERRSRSDSAIRLALGGNGGLVRRPDGKPELIAEPGGVSASHCGDVTMAVAGQSPLACDIQAVTHRAIAVWQDLLGDDAFKLAQVVSRISGDDFDAAATRVWAAGECLRKSGVPVGAPLTLLDWSEGSAVLSSGNLSIVTVCVTITQGLGPTVIAVLSSCNRATFAENTDFRYETAGLGPHPIPG